MLLLSARRAGDLTLALHSPRGILFAEIPFPPNSVNITLFTGLGGGGGSNPEKKDACYQLVKGLKFKRQGKIAA